MTTEITVSEIRSLFGITSDIMSDDEISSILTFVGVSTVDIPSTLDVDTVKFLEYLQFGCIAFRTRNPANYLKKGIKSWNIGRISVSFDVTDVSDLGKVFCEEYERYLTKLTKGRNRGYVGITNSGNGLWQSTQSRGPVFIQIGNGARG